MRHPHHHDITDAHNTTEPPTRHHTYYDVIVSNVRYCDGPPQTTHQALVNGVENVVQPLLKGPVRGQLLLHSLTPTSTGNGKYTITNVCD
jgi:hypothetical protein